MPCFNIFSELRCLFVCVCLLVMILGGEPRCVCIDLECGMYISGDFFVLLYNAYIHMMYPLPSLSRACRCVCIRACVGAYSRVSRVLAVVLASELMSAHSPCISRACRCDCIRACFCSYAEPPMHVSFCYSIRVRPVVIAYAVTRAWLGAN